MSEKRYYANVPDLAQIPAPILSLVMSDWFDKRDIIFDKDRIDGSYTRVVGEDTEQIGARVELLKEQKSVRNGGGVRIKPN